MKISNTVMWIIGAVILIGLLGWATARILNNAAPTFEVNNATSIGPSLQKNS